MVEYYSGYSKSKLQMIIGRIQYQIHDGYSYPILITGLTRHPRPIQTAICSCPRLSSGSSKASQTSPGSWTPRESPHLCSSGTPSCPCCTSSPGLLSASPLCSTKPQRPCPVLISSECRTWPKGPFYIPSTASPPSWNLSVRPRSASSSRSVCQQL